MMKNCLIMGSGRSGTSLMAGMLFNAGYFMGEDMLLPHDSNPKGFFESAEINTINEVILSSYNIRPSLNGYYALFPRALKKYPVKKQRWLTSIPPSIPIECEENTVNSRIIEAIQKEPFCYKDPRFSYTYPVWKKFLKPDTRFICVFREPDIIVQSILVECKRREYLRDFYISRRNAFQLLENIYLHIFKNFKDRSDMLYVHYRQLIDRTALERISNFLDCQVSGDFVDPKLVRSIPVGKVPVPMIEVYRKLCHLAGYP